MLVIVTNSLFCVAHKLGNIFYVLANHDFMSCPRVPECMRGNTLDPQYCVYSIEARLYVSYLTLTKDNGPWTTDRVCCGHFSNLSSTSVFNLSCLRVFL